METLQKPLRGCVLWLCPLGTMSSVRRSIFEARVSELGGEIAESPTENVTHFVVSSSVTTGAFWKLGYEVPKSTEVVSDAWLVESLTQCKMVSTHAYQHSQWTHDSASHWMHEFLLATPGQKRRKLDGPVTAVAEENATKNKLVT